MSTRQANLACAEIQRIESENSAVPVSELYTMSEKSLVDILRRAYMSGRGEGYQKGFQNGRDDFWNLY